MDAGSLRRRLRVLRALRLYYLATHVSTMFLAGGITSYKSNKSYSFIRFVELGRIFASGVEYLRAAPLYRVCKFMD